MSAFFTLLLWSCLWLIAHSHQTTAFLPKLYRVLKPYNFSHGNKVTHAPTIRAEYQHENYRIRQVPGDGGCMFHALATCMHFGERKEHFTQFDPDIRVRSTGLREMAVRTLQKPNCSFVLLASDEATITNHDLLHMVASEYNTTAEHYCSRMLQPQTWGGSPELMALAHSLQTPIHVYELATKIYFPFRFYLTRTAQFDHIFDSSTQQFIKLTKPPLEILFTSGKFPELSPMMSKQPIEGDHFLALFPVERSQGRGSEFLTLLKSTAVRGQEILRSRAKGVLKLPQVLRAAIVKNRKQFNK